MDGVAVEVVERAAERLSGDAGADGARSAVWLTIRGLVTWASPVEVPPD